MSLVIVVVTQLLAADADGAKPKPPPMEAMTPDGGEVPIVAPRLAGPMEKVLAPDLAPDGGQPQPDGGIAEIVTRPTLSVYNVDLPAETALTIGSFGLYLMVDILIKPTLQGESSCGGGQCDLSTLSAFDRVAVGKSSKEWSTLSDVLLATSVGLPIAYLALESFVLPTREPIKDWAKDLVVVAEAMAMTAAIDTVLKFAFRRPRPDRYLPLAEGATLNFDDELSLPSGHASEVAAATTALATTIFFRHPKSKLRWVALSAAVVLTSVTAVSRVMSGYHFPTDTITGALVGSFAGFVVPYMHLRNDLRPTFALNPTTGSSMIGIAGAF
jgi:hypothetical protein